LGAPGQVGERVADGIDVFDVHGVLSVGLAVFEGRDFDTGEASAVCWPARASAGFVAALWPNGVRALVARALLVKAAWMQLPETYREHWQRNLRLTAALLALWFVVTFVLAYFARDLNVTLFGWPFSFWVACQGALVVYAIIIGYYARCMSKLDDECGLSETDDA
jgi:putative solute:sodium symporter small subunit